MTKTPSSLDELREQLARKLSAKRIAHTPIGDTEILNASLIANALVPIIQAYIANELREVIGIAESCEPECDDVRHARHQGSWDTVVAQEARALNRGYDINPKSKETS